LEVQSSELRPVGHAEHVAALGPVLDAAPFASAALVAAVLEPRSSSPLGEHSCGEQGQAQGTRRSDSLLSSPRSPRISARDQRDQPASPTQRVRMQGDGGGQSDSVSPRRPRLGVSSAVESKDGARVACSQPQQHPVASRFAVSSIAGVPRSVYSSPPKVGLQLNVGNMDKFGSSSHGARLATSAPRIHCTTSVLDRTRQADILGNPTAQGLNTSFTFSQPASPATPKQHSPLSKSIPAELQRTLDTQRARLGVPFQSQRTTSAASREHTPGDRAVVHSPQRHNGVFVRQQISVDCSSIEQESPRAVLQPQRTAGVANARTFSFQAPDGGQSQQLQAGVQRQRSAASSADIPMPTAAVQLLASPKHSNIGGARTPQPIVAAQPPTSPVMQQALQVSNTASARVPQLAAAARPSSGSIKERFQQVGPAQIPVGQGQRLEWSLSNLSHPGQRHILEGPGSPQQRPEQVSVNVSSPSSSVLSSGQSQRGSPCFSPKARRQESAPTLRTERCTLGAQACDLSGSVTSRTPEAVLAVPQVAAVVADRFAGFDLRSLDGPVSVRCYQAPQHGSDAGAAGGAPESAERAGQVTSGQGLGQQPRGVQGGVAVGPLVRRFASWGAGVRSRTGTVGCLPFGGLL